jgi:hypothetical protein
VLDEDDAEDDDDERLVDEVADADALLADDDGAAGEFSGLEVAGAVVVGGVGVGVVVPVVDEELLASSPRVVVPDEDELPTSAETGFCPISSIPVTIAIATTNTETA